MQCHVPHHQAWLLLRSTPFFQSGRILHRYMGCRYTLRRDGHALRHPSCTLPFSLSTSQLRRTEYHLPVRLLDYGHHLSCGALYHALTSPAAPRPSCGTTPGWWPGGGCWSSRWALCAGLRQPHSSETWQTHLAKCIPAAVCSPRLSAIVKMFVPVTVCSRPCLQVVLDVLRGGPRSLGYDAHGRPLAALVMFRWASAKGQS